MKPKRLTHKNDFMTGKEKLNGKQATTSSGTGKSIVLFKGAEWANELASAARNLQYSWFRKETADRGAASCPPITAPRKGDEKTIVPGQKIEDPYIEREQGMQKVSNIGVF